MIRLLSFLALVFICTPLIGQQQTPSPSDCIQGFNIESRISTNDDQPINDVVISWNFSETTNRENLEIALKVQPLNACWKGIEGTTRAGDKTFKILNTSENPIGNQHLIYSDLYCKCFKWQVIILDSTTNCETKTDWQFSSFL